MGNSGSKSSNGHHLFVKKKECMKERCKSQTRLSLTEQLSVKNRHCSISLNAINLRAAFLFVTKLIQSKIVIKSRLDTYPRSNVVDVQ